MLGPGGAKKGDWGKAEILEWRGSPEPEMKGDQETSKGNSFTTSVAFQTALPRFLLVVFIADGPCARKGRQELYQYRTAESPRRRSASSAGGVSGFIYRLDRDKLRVARRREGRCPLRPT
jgi:hypothetical protein